MSGALIKRYYVVDSFEAAHSGLASVELTNGPALASRDHTTVDWLGETYDPPEQVDEEGNETVPGVYQGVLLNVYSRRADVIEALDALFVRNHPASPLRDLAGTDTP